MKSFQHLFDRPNLRLYLLLPVLHYAAVRISFFCGKTPENEVIIWLPNAVLLAALLHFRGERWIVFAALTFCSNVIGNLPTAGWAESASLSLVNLFEIGMTYFLMLKSGASPRLAHIQDFGKFVVAGPLVSAFFSGLLGAAVIVAFGGASSYLTLMRVWWFDDGLGLLIFTPLLLLGAEANEEPTPWKLSDRLVLLFTIALVCLLFVIRSSETNAFPLTPTMLIPSMLYLAVRLSVLWSAFGVAAISLAVSRMAAVSLRPFGETSGNMSIIHVQEFILTLSVICMGAAILLRQIREHEHGLEQAVQERTAELSASLEQLQAAQTDLVQAEKLASLGSLVAGISHELNTPIGNSVTIVSSLADRMHKMHKSLTNENLRRSELKQYFEEGIEMMALLDRSVTRASDMILSFKMVAVDRTSERHRTFKLRQLVEDIEQIWHFGDRYAPFSITVDVAPDIECSSYPGPLGQIISNLIQNAALHAFEENIAAPAFRSLRIGATVTGEHVVMTFADNGKGMDAPTMARIFDPFFTTRLGQGGSGLGLFICSNIASGVLGGTLSVESRPGAGTKFKLVFPRSLPG